MAKEKKYPPISAKIPHIIHGGDYNPDQWINTPEIWDEDMRLMKLAGCNTMTLGIFSWSMLEPEEGVFDFAWLDTIVDKLADNGIYAILSTPTGARPAWMAQKYPEVLRVEMDRQRIKFSGRHNHCFTSPIYREKASIINRKLAERYGSHPALIAWHISNEYSSYCHCPMCQEAFRDFLKQKYDNDLEKLNAEWWTGFWSRRFTDWSQIESPTSVNEGSLHALVIDWNRFVTHQTIDFYKNEIKPLRELTPDMPVTTNFMVLFSGCDYWDFAKEVDVVSWDSYPSWGTDQLSTAEVAANAGFAHDLYRSLKGGGSFVTTYWSGRVNENDLCYLGGFPGPLRRLLGVWAEEIDSLYDSQSNSLVISEENELGLSGKFEVHDFCDLFMVLRCLR